MVDPKNLIFLGAGLHHPIQLLGAAVVAAEGLLDHHPTAVGIGQQPGGRQGPAATAVESRRHRQVKGAVAPGGALSVDALQPLAQLHDGGGIGEVGRLIEEAAGKALPSGGVLTDHSGHRRSHAGAKLLVTPGPAGAANHGKLAGQAPLPKQLKQGRDQLAMGEIAAGAKDHQTLGRNHPLLPQPHTQGIGEHAGHRVP